MTIEMMEVLELHQEDVVVGSLIWDSGYTPYMHKTKCTQTTMTHADQLNNNEQGREGPA